jgi:RimJ/RimL family protein N-acetyltransferase
MLPPTPRPCASAPVTLETARLRMRPPRLSDFPASFEMWSSPVVVRYVSGQPSTREEAWARMLRKSGCWSLLGYGPWTVERLDTGDFVGEVGMFEFQRDIEPDFGGRPEVGWMLTPAAHGAGFATEAVRAALAWADEHLQAPGTVCITSPANAASIAVAGKCGFRQAGTAIYKKETTLLFERPRGG